MKKHFTYITINLLNNKKYVGDHSTDNLDDGYLGSGRDLKKDISKYGRKMFDREILEFFNTKQEAFNAQKKYIKEYNTHISQGGYNRNWTGGQWASNPSKKTKEKISSGVKKAFKQNPDILNKISKKSRINSIGEKNGMYGKRMDPEKMRKRWIDYQHPWIGRSHTSETKEKISKSHIGKIMPAETKEKISESTSGNNNPMYGKKHDPISKEKQRISALNRKKIKCGYCGKEISPGMYKRWHGINCKNNI